MHLGTLCTFGPDMCIPEMDCSTFQLHRTNIPHRYFMFHAAVVTVVCLCADPVSTDAPLWIEDLEIARAALTVEFSTNRLATRCLEILDRLRPNRTSNVDGLGFVPLEASDSMGKSRLWSTNVAESFNILDWPVFGEEFA